MIQRLHTSDAQNRYDILNIDTVSIFISIFISILLLPDRSQIDPNTAISDRRTWAHGRQPNWRWLAACGRAGNASDVGRQLVADGASVVTRKRDFATTKW